MNFLKLTYQPTLGRNFVFTDNFNPGSSSIPLNFKIVGMRHADGTPAPEMDVTHPTKIWTKPYLGTEKSLAEIEAKRTISYLPPFSIREHNGEFVVWSSAKSDQIRCSPDPGYLFDVEVSNSGGTKYFRDLKLQPFRERPYEPSNLDPESGVATEVSLHPTTLSNMIGENSQLGLSLNDVDVYFHKLDTVFADSINTLTFKFLDSSFHPINPTNFNQTNWDNLVHGFNMKKTDSFVRYQVAYPIPLINYPTQYTDVNGTNAHLVFAYDRMGYGGFRQTTSMTFDFSIFEEGNWEIDFVFNKDTPRFENEDY
jgi:hypothetical protein